MRADRVSLPACRHVSMPRCRRARQFLWFGRNVSPRHLVRRVPASSPGRSDGYGRGEVLERGRGRGKESLERPESLASVGRNPSQVLGGGGGRMPRMTRRVGAAESRLSLPLFFSGSVTPFYHFLSSFPRRSPSAVMLKWPFPPLVESPREATNVSNLVAKKGPERTGRDGDEASRAREEGSLRRTSSNSTCSQPPPRAHGGYIEGTQVTDLVSPVPAAPRRRARGLPAGAYNDREAHREGRVSKR